MSPLTVEPLSRIRPEPIRWLWPAYLPRGKVAVLDGDPGVGKSLLTIDLAARLSRGRPLPDGSPVARPLTTLLLSAEDAAADTTRPRAEAAGADLDRVVVVGGADSPVCLDARVPELGELVRVHGIDLVVIDPITAFLPRQVAANSDQCVREVLGRLALVAERFDCTILLVRHLRKQGAKKAIYRGAGSIGLIAAARAGLLAARHPADPTLGVLAVAKSNLAGSVPSLGYRVMGRDAGRAVVEWVGPVNLTADGLGALPPVPLRPRDRAAEWLRGELAGGPRKAAAVQAAATAAGIPEATLKRAKAELRVGSHRVQRAGGAEWWWYDPDAPWPADAALAKPFELSPLTELPPL